MKDRSAFFVVGARGACESVPPFCLFLALRDVKLTEVHEKSYVN